MKKLMGILLAGGALVLSQGFRTVAAAQGYIPLEATAGTFSFTVHGFLALCLENTPTHPLTVCGSANSTVVPLTIEDVGVYTLDNDGNGCGTIVETEAAFPVGTSPTTVLEIHSVSHTTQYDPQTGTGDASVTNYSGGKCNDSSFDGPATFDSTGAIVISTLTDHFTVSDGGQRLDFVVTFLTNPVGLGIGGFSLPGTLLRK